MKDKKTIIEVKGAGVAILSHGADDFISITDIAKFKEPDRADHVIQNWMRNRNTIEFLGIWENLNNPDFKPLEFEGFRNRAGLNSFVLANIEGMNAEFIHMALPQPERLKRLNAIAIRQMQTLTADAARLIGKDEG